MPHWTFKFIIYGEVSEHEIEAPDLASAMALALAAEGLTENDEGSYTIEVSGG